MSKTFVLYDPKLNCIGTRELAADGTDPVTNINRSATRGGMRLAPYPTPSLRGNLSNVHARKACRRDSCLPDVVVGATTVQGAAGYELAVEAAIRRLKRNSEINP